VIDHRCNDKERKVLAMIPNMMTFTGVLAVGYIEGVHGSGVLVGYTESYFGHIFTGCIVVGFVKSKQKA